MKRIISVMLVLVCVFMLSACDKTVKLEYEGSDKLMDKKNGITYTKAPFFIEPAALSGEPYGKAKDELLGEVIELFEITDLDPKEWLAESYTGGRYVYWAGGSLEDVDLEAFEPNWLAICAEDVVTQMLSAVDDAEAVKAVVEAYKNGKETDRPANSSATRFYLKFASDKYLGLRFALDYYMADDGTNYIYNGWTNECREVGDVLLAYMPKK